VHQSRQVEQYDYLDEVSRLLRRHELGLIGAGQEVPAAAAGDQRPALPGGRQVEPAEPDLE